MAIGQRISHGYEQATNAGANQRLQLAANTAGLAVAQMTYQAIGTGQKRVATPLTFPLVFRGEPHLATGCATLSLSAPSIWHDPVGTAGLTAWQRDDRGNYLGAWIWVRVEVAAIDPTVASDPPRVATLIYLTFTGVAIKDLPAPTASTATPRPVGV